jgi:hypothetical protein
MRDLADQGGLDCNDGEDNDRSDESALDSVRLTTVFEHVVQELSGSVHQHFLDSLCGQSTWGTRCVCVANVDDSALWRSLEQFHLSNEGGIKWKGSEPLLCM